MKSNLDACKKVLYIDALKSGLESIFKFPIIICLSMYFITKDIDYTYLVVCSAICLVVNKFTNTFFISPKDGYVDEKDIRS